MSDAEQRREHPSEDAFTALDDAWRAHVGTTPAGGSLLLQTIAAAPARRRHLGVLPAAPGSVVLDVGVGFGALLFEVARRVPMRAIGLDLDPAVLEVTTAVAGQLAGWFAPGSSFQFLLAGADAIPLAPASVDCVLIRLVLQHLPDPRRALDEARRVLRPGGRIVVFDVDDGLSLTHPPPSTTEALLEGAFAAWQSRYGGDRHIGRRLAPLLEEVGFHVDALEVEAQSAYLRGPDRALERTIDLARLRAAADGVVADGTFTQAEYERLLERFEREAPDDTVRVEGQFVVLATKREG